LSDFDHFPVKIEYFLNYNDFFSHPN
jgi:hypothetical protein